MYLRDIATINRIPLELMLNIKKEITADMQLGIFSKLSDSFIESNSKNIDKTLPLSTQQGLKDNCYKELPKYLKTISSRLSNCSKTVILQYILYHFLPIRANGQTDVVLISELSAKLNVTEKTIKSNNSVLEELGLISVILNECGVVQFEINGYADAFKDNGHGTINITLAHFEESFINSNKDVVKTTLFLYIKALSSKGYFGVKHLTTVSTKQLRNIFPKGKNYKKHIKNTVKSVKGFIIKQGRKVLDIPTCVNIKFDIEDKFNAIIQKSKINDYNTNALVDCINSKFKLSIEDMDDVLQLGLIYGTNNVLKTLNTMQVPSNEYIFAKYVRHALRLHYLETNNIDFSDYI